MRTRRFESREASIYCGFEGRFVLNRTARNRLKQARRAILRCGWTMSRWNNNHFYCLNEAGQKREICLYYNAQTGKTMISFRLDDFRLDDGLWAEPECQLWAAPDCHITTWQLEHAIQTRPAAGN